MRQFKIVEEGEYNKRGVGLYNTAFGWPPVVSITSDATTLVIGEGHTVEEALMAMTDAFLRQRAENERIRGAGEERG